MLIFCLKFWQSDIEISGFIEEMEKEFVIPFLSKDGRQVNMQVRQKNLKVTKRKVKTWSNEEDNQLLELYQRFPKKWGEIAAQMVDRNDNQCLHRYRRLSQLGKSHKIWSAEEDNAIRKLIKKYGKNWKLLSEMLGSKNGKQIRERFINKLDPRIKKEEWSEEQDRKVLELYSKIGSKWSEISKHLSGRPQNKIKNRFYSFIQKNYDICFKEVENLDPTRDVTSEYKSTMQVDSRTVPFQSPEEKSSIIYENREEGRRSEERICSKFQIPSINQIDFDVRNEPLASNNLLESVLRVEDDWRMGNHYQSILELHSTDLFSKFQN